MTDSTHSSLLIQDKRTTKRNRAEARFKTYGLIAIGIGVLMLVILLTSIIGRGSGAFQQTYLTVDVTLTEAKLDKKGNRDIDDIKKVSTFGYKPLLVNAFEELVTSGAVTSDLKPKKMSGILSKGAEAQMRNAVIADPTLIGQTVSFDFLASGRVDGYLKGRVTRASIGNDKNI